jgi:4-amino-4-deoxy-L-arabinose transferase-like glycosyltransferase
MSHPPQLSRLDRLAQSPWAFAVIALLVLACVLPGVFSMPVLDRDEARFAQATRQMLESGDFINIMVQDEPRNKKPIGIHWLQAFTAGATTHAEIWGFRLASVLGALLSAFAIFWAGANLVSRTAGFAGALLFAAAILPSTEGMIAKTDAVLCGLTALAMAALARLYAKPATPSEGRATALVFWAALGAGVLVKGPITPLVAGLALAALYGWERKAAWMRPLRHWSGPALAALVVLPWMAAIWIETGGAFFTEALGEDLGPKVAGGDEGHSGVPGLHAVLAPLLFFPATFVLIPALREAANAFRAPSAQTTPSAARFLVAWALPIWILFELLPTKLVHYVLPAYPALALLAGIALTQALQWSALTRALGILLTLLAGAALVAGAAHLATFMPGAEQEDQRRAVQAAMVGAGALLIAAFGLWRARSPSAILGAIALIGAATAYGVRERLLPEAAELLVSAETATALERIDLGEDPARRLVIIGFRETSLVFETRTDAVLLSHADAAQQVLPGDDVVLNTASADISLFQAGLTARGLAFQPLGEPIEGLNYSNGDTVTLSPGRIASISASGL